MKKKNYKVKKFLSILSKIPFILEAFIGGIGISILLLFIKEDDPNYIGVALSFVLGLVAVLLSLNRIMISLSNKKNSDILIDIQKKIIIRNHLDDLFDKLFQNNFDVNISKEMMDKIAKERLVLNEAEFYSFLNEKIFESIFKLSSAEKNNVHIYAVSFNDAEWKNSSEEDAFVKTSLDLCRVGIDYKRLFVLTNEEIESIISNEEYKKACLAHLDCFTPYINSKIILQDVPHDGAIAENIKKFGAGFLCVEILDAYIFVYDISGDGSRGHIFIDQNEAEKIITAFKSIWDSKKSIDFTNTLLSDKYKKITEKNICPGCDATIRKKKKCLSVCTK